jgi:hypothetical protein
MFSVYLHYDNVNKYLVFAASPDSASAKLHTSWKLFFSPYAFRDEAKLISSETTDVALAAPRGSIL